MLGKINDEGLFLTIRIEQVNDKETFLLHSKDHKKSPLKETLLQVKQIPRNN